MFYGQSLLDKVIYERFFLNVKNGFFVECGAFDGLTECNCKFFEEDMGWNGINIEPLLYIFELLVTNRPKSKNLNLALTNKNGPILFTQAIHPKLGNRFGNGSVSHTPMHRRELDGMGCSYETHTVEGERFDSVAIKLGIRHIDLFVLDVEGHEIEALEGILAVPVPILPSVMCVEHTICDKSKLEDIMAPLYSFHSEYIHDSFYVRR